MRKLIVLTFVTLDGVMQAPGGLEEDTSGGFKYGGWTVPYFDEFSNKVVGEQMKQPFNLLLGRTTFEIFASYWPQHASDWPGINEATKYVVSSTLTKHDWKNSVFIKGDVVEEIKKLKMQDGPDLQVYGCIDKPTDGQVLLDSIDVGKMPENQLYKIRRNKMGFVFQTFNLLPYLNARENVELPMEGKINSKAERKKRASELLAMVGLSGRENHRPHRLSAGEQQRVAIARALANNPAFILADEPTGNLDSQNKAEIIKLLANLNLTHGTTIIMVTHDGQAANHTERILLLKDGKIIKEKEGLHLSKKNNKCPNCGGSIKSTDDVCPICKKPLLTPEELFSA